MLRTSSYTIYVALPENEREMLLVHGYTGAYNKVPVEVAQYLQSLDPFGPSKPLYGEWVAEPAVTAATTQVVTPAEKTLNHLKRRGFLTEKDVDEEVGYFARVAKRLHARNVTSRPSYIVMPTYDCNLRCAYCFQNHMRTDASYKHLLRTISQDMIDRMFLAFEHIEESHAAGRKRPSRRDIGFFGGEPLLASNRPAIEYIIEKGKSLAATNFWAVSNATELDAYADLLGGDNIRRIQITMDGPPKEHDKRRIYADGSGSFERIARNVDLCLDKGVTVSMRMNIDRANIDQLPEFASVVHERGWDSRKGFSIYTAPITNASQSVSLTELRSQYFNSWELDQALTKLRETHPIVALIFRPTDQMQAQAFGIFERKGGGLGELKSSFCGAHTGMYIFDAFGDIYACWERTGDERIRIGKVLPDGQVELSEPMTRMWRTRTPASNATCRKCRYALHCGGGCAVLAEGRNGKLHSNHCDGFAERFRYSVGQAYVAYVSGKRLDGSARVCDL